MPGTHAVSAGWLAAVSNVAHGTLRLRLELRLLLGSCLADHSSRILIVSLAKTSSMFRAVASVFEAQQTARGLRLVAESSIACGACAAERPPVFLAALDSAFRVAHLSSVLEPDDFGMPEAQAVSAGDRLITSGYLTRC
jgi:hypothetical protein